LPISVNAAAVMAASTALSRKQPAGGAVGHLPPPRRTAALLKLVAASCLRVVGVNGAAPDALGGLRGHDKSDTTSS